MAYTLNSLRLVYQSIDNIVPARWALAGTDSDATVLAAGYISDGGHLGVKKGDIVEYLLTTTPALYTHVVTAVSTTFPGGLTLGSTPTTSS